MRALILLVIALLLPHSAQAVLPPDILFSITSTASQSLVLIGVVVSGMWLSLTTFVRNGSWKFWLVQICIATLLIGSIVYIFRSTEAPERVSVPTVSDGRMPELSALRIVLVGKNTQEPVAIEFDLNVRAVDTEYEYFHYGALVVGNRSYDAYIDGPINALTLAPAGYINELAINRAPDLSARYEIRIAAQIGGQYIEADISDLNGDFLEKNTPLYFKEASFGKASVLLNGVALDAYAFVSPVYSHDYRQTVYFDGFDEVRGLASQFVVFDTEGNVYVVDRSDIENPVPAYSSHQWVLMKKSDGAAYKGFSADVEGDAVGEGAQTWKVTSHDVPFILQLTSHQRYSGGLKGRTVSGSVLLPSGVSLPVIGIAHIETL